MSETTEVAELHPAGEAQERFGFECAGGTLGVVAASDRLTPYGGVAAWSHYLEKVGVVADLARRFPRARTSPNATPVADVVQAFMFNCLMGGRRFAHARRVQDDQAVAVILGMKKAGCAARMRSRACWPRCPGRRPAPGCDGANAISMRPCPRPSPRTGTPR